MYNAIKSLIIIGAITLFSACADNSRQQTAEELLNQATELSTAGDYSGAIDCLDTLDIKYRDCVEQRRKGSQLRIETLIRLTQDSITIDENRRPALQSKVDSLRQLFKTVSLEGTEGFIVHSKLFTGSDLNSTTIQPRIDPDGYFFVVANVSGRKIGLNSLEYNGIKTPSVNSVAVGNSEIMSLPQECVVQFSQAIANAPTGKLKINLIGTKGNAQITLTKAQADAFRTTWQFAQLSQMLNTANIRREKYERQLTDLTSRLNDLVQRMDSTTQEK